MSDNPLDRLPTFNRVSIRAVLVHAGEDASAALAQAGLVNAVAIPVVLGETLDLAGGILGNGITPNLTAVLETAQEIAFASPPDTQPVALGSDSDKAQPSGPVTTTLPAAFGMRPLAPVCPVEHTGS